MRKEGIAPSPYQEALTPKVGSCDRMVYGWNNPVGSRSEQVWMEGARNLRRDKRRGKARFGVRGRCSLVRRREDTTCYCRREARAVMRGAKSQLMEELRRVRSTRSGRQDLIDVSRRHKARLGRGWNKVGVAERYPMPQVRLDISGKGRAGE